ncbi:MAG TPA: hypothetical protein VFU69_19370, partial [Ktedonobacterales bacterium]|nr:hypothetical protein [Ktedonobacterales bacterium]
MDFADSRSERFVASPSAAEATPTQDTGFGATAPMPPLASPAAPLSPMAGAAPLPEPKKAMPVGSGSASVFRIDQERLAALQDRNWRRVRALLWVLAVGVALGFLLLIPAVHQPPPAPVHLVGHGGGPAPIRQNIPQRPLWAAILLVVSVSAPLLALALGLLALPPLLWRAVWLRRQRDLHLAIGRQGLLFFLPGQIGRWFLLPWGHITAMTDVTVAPQRGRWARLRTVLWRRWARLQRAFRRGRHLGIAAAATTPMRSPFLLHARAAGPQQRLRVVCYARLPDSGYSWLFSLAPFTRRVGSATFRLDSGWFESAASPPGASLHQALLGLWASSLARAQRAPLPLPRERGAVLLDAPAPSLEPGPEARRVDGAAWAALPLVPALSAAALGIALVTRQALQASDTLNLATLGTLTLGLALLLAGTRWPRQGRLFASGAFLLALAGALNFIYAVAVLQAWPWSVQVAPEEPIFFLEALASLLLALGGVALGLEGSGRQGARSAATRSAGLGARLHSPEVVVVLSLLALGLARALVDIDLAALNTGAATLQWLRYILAEPLLPLAIIGLSYFSLLTGPALQTFTRVLQIIYGLVLALLVPAAFIFVYRANGGPRPVPPEWLPLLIVEFVCGLL